jgi:hypothetical protein
LMYLSHECVLWSVQHTLLLLLTLSFLPSLFNSFQYVIYLHRCNIFKYCWLSFSFPFPTRQLAIFRESADNIYLPYSIFYLLTPFYKDVHSTRKKTQMYFVYYYISLMYVIHLVINNKIII